MTMSVTATVGQALYKAINRHAVAYRSISASRATKPSASKMMHVASPCPWFIGLPNGVPAARSG
eukprot:COSAG01_NODE_47889_length_386_cov_0.679443_1_plen_63_part_10